ncbi:hypothetical protein HAX54_029306, partial [Datura stramonium]|nr:hypothetical protein [Datura stramonium]
MMHVFTPVITKLAWICVEFVHWWFMAVVEKEEKRKREGQSGGFPVLFCPKNVRLGGGLEGEWEMKEMERRGCSDDFLRQRRGRV